MKYIIAIIQPDRLDEVMAALEEEDVNLITVSDVMGRGRQKGVAEVYRSHIERGGLLRKVKIEIAVNDSFVAPTIDAITRGARTGQHRRRQDLRARPRGVPAYPHRRDGQRGYRLTPEHTGGPGALPGPRRLGQYYIWPSPTGCCWTSGDSLPCPGTL